MARDPLAVTIRSLRLIRPRLEVYYPAVTGMTNLAVQQRINNAIISLMYKMIADQGYYQNPQTEITGTYELKTNQRGILSLNLIIYAFSGGAHGLTVVKSITTDLATGRIYQLQDLFKPGVDWSKTLADIIRKQIAARDIPLLVDYPGITKNQDFYIGDKALVIYYQLYELAAYVYGILYFPISVYEIANIINEDGPLGKMMY